MSAASNSWMPTPGRYDVGIGSSLGRALKARKGAPMNNKMPTRDFYALRYNFMPESVDPTKPGTIDVKKTKDSTAITVERAGVQSGEGGYAFVGSETVAKEWECVLIYDEESGMFSLEKVDSFVTLTYDRKTSTGPKHAGSPLPATSRPSPIPPPQNHVQSTRMQKTQARTAADELQAALEREMLMDEDAEGEPDDGVDVLPTEPPLPLPPARKEPSAIQEKKPKPKPVALSSRTAGIKAAAKAKEEDDESDGPLSEAVRRGKPKAPTTSTPKSSQAKAKAAPKQVNIMLPTKPRPTPKAKSSPASVNPAPPKPSPKTVVGAKRSHQPEEETFNLSLPSQPSRPAKRPRPSPPPAPPPPKPREPVALALPSGEGISLPGAPLALPSSSSIPTLPPVPPLEDSDDDDEWDDAFPPPDPLSVGPPPGMSIVMEEIVPTTIRRVEEDEPPSFAEDAEGEEEGIEIDADFLEMEMNEHLEEDESDFLAEAIASPTEPAMGGGAPMSWRAAAGGGAELDNLWGEDDDTSSSDDSDDD